MTESQKVSMYAQIEQHGKNLNAIFNTGLDPVKLCKKLRPLELKANKLATDYCNGENGIDSYEAFEKAMQPLLKSLYKVLYIDNNPYLQGIIQVNGDARGYTFKISDEVMREQKLVLHKDWGGYGIICPEFNGI